MKTSQQPTSQSGADEWTCSLAAFRASLSVMPGDEEARRMTATSGRQCIAPSTKSSPLGLWLRTLLESSRWSSRARFLRWQVQPLFSTRLTTFEDDTNCERPLPFNASAQTLKVTDMPSSRCLFRLVPSEPPTDETGCSSSQGVLLQTPTTVQTDEPPEKMRARAEKNGYKNGTKFGSLTSQIKYDPRVAMQLNIDMLPTPLTRDYKGGTTAIRKDTGKVRTDALDSCVKYMVENDLLPTPRSNQVNGCDLNNPKLADRNKSNLEEEIAKMVVDGLLPTPICSDGEAGGCAAIRKDTGKQRMDCLRHFAACITTELDDNGNPKYAERDGGASRLSPLFTEEMMGFPLMWTALPFLSESGAPKPSKPTATPSSPK